MPFSASTSPAARLALLLVGAGAAGSCAAPPASVYGEPRFVPATWRLVDEEAVRPTLEEVFLEPPIAGTAPRLSSLSADGAFALVDWAPASGDEEPKGPRSPLLLATDGSGAGPAGTPLAELLPAVDDEDGSPRALRTTWSQAGHRLAVARGRELWLVDPAGREAALLARWDAPPAVEDGEEEEVPARRALGSVRLLHFASDDRSVRVTDGRELFEFFVPPAPPERPFGLDEATFWTKDVAARVDQLSWADDLSVAVGTEHPPRPEEDPDAEVWLVLEERAVDLEGLAEIEELEDLYLAPDGAYVFGMELDRSADPEPVEVPDYLTERVTHRRGRRKLADDRPSPARLWIWNTSTGAREELLVPPRSTAPPPDGGGESDEQPAAPLDRFRVVGWAPAGPPRLAVERYSEDARELELWLWEPGSFRRIYFERDEGWIGGPSRITRWGEDGVLLLGSEVCSSSTTPGASQLFRLDPRTEELTQLTAFVGEMVGFTPLASGGVLVRASDADPARRGYYLVSAAAVRGEWSDPPRRYATPEGWNQGGRASADGSRLVFLHETLLRPAEIHAADSERSLRLTDTVPADFESVAWIRPERLEARASDGALVHAHVYLPPGVELQDPGPPRAAIVFVHGAGYLQNVTDSMTRYPLNAMFHSRLAHLGYPVIDVDYRGSAGYGQSFRTDVQYHLGGRDLDDIHLVVDALVEAGLVDAERVGVYGGSYGGFLTLMALFTAPERWAVGCALRSVTDWRTYHPGYTQPRLGRPSTHAEAYRRSSPIDLVDGLEDPLLVLHGMVDSNVFAQDSIRLIEELIDRGKDFDAMLYPSQGHAFRDGEHWLDEYRRIERYLIDHLGPPLRDDGEDYAVWVGTGWTYRDPNQGGYNVDPTTPTIIGTVDVGPALGAQTGGRGR
ncbi:MAG: prolyl oligopeptidase family serine peptidase [Planctomycetota bacterium]